MSNFDMDVQALLSAAAFAQRSDASFFHDLAGELPGNDAHEGRLDGARLTLPAAFAQLFTGRSQPMHVSVQLVHNPDGVVYVFSDAETGSVVFSVPPEIVVKLAEMFNSTSGVLLDGHS